MTFKFKLIITLIVAFCSALGSFAVTYNAAYLLTTEQSKIEQHQYDYFWSKASDVCGGTIKEFMVYEDRVEASCL